MRKIKGFMMSLGMFSALPVPNLWEDTLLPLVIPCLPLVGAVIGLVWYGVALGLWALQFPFLLGAVLLLLCPLLLSGCIHMDGLMDCCDAIFSRGAPAKKRQILKDAHVGAFAVIGLCVVLLLAVASLYTGLAARKSLLLFVFLPVVSRGVAGLCLLGMPPLSKEGYGASFRKNTRPVHGVFLGSILAVALGLGWYFGGAPQLCVLGVAGLGGALAAGFATKDLGGISGDVCGFSITLAELAGLFCWALV